MYVMYHYSKLLKILLSDQYSSAAILQFKHVSGFGRKPGTYPLITTMIILGSKTFVMTSLLNSICTTLRTYTILFIGKKLVQLSNNPKNYTFLK